MIFMTKDFREWKTMILREGKTMILETHEVSLRDAPTHCLERISRHQHKEKEWKLS